MKRFLTILAAAATVALAVPSCKEDTPEFEGPSIAWPSNSDFSVEEIDEDLDATLIVTAPAGIQSLIVKVESESESFMKSLTGMFGSSTLDLVNDTKVIALLAGVAPSLPTGEALRDETEVNFDITSLTGMILAVAGDEDANHSFTVTITDNNGKNVSATCTFHSTPAGGTDEPGETPAQPTIAWPGNSTFASMPISPDMQAELDITAAGGIKTFVVTAPQSLETILSVFRLTTTLDFINNEQLVQILSSMDYTVGSELKGAMSVKLDMQPLLGMLSNGIAAGSYTFTLTVTDNADQKAEANLTFEKVDETAQLSLTQVDLWANTAVLTVSGNPSSVAYRVKGETEWNSLTAGTDGNYAIAPTWTPGQNPARLDVYNPDEFTGIWAGKTYEFQVDGEVAEYTYTAAEGDAIPNGDMSQWSENSRGVTAPNAKGESFWDSGNNSMSKELCTNDKGSAHLKPYSITLFEAFACGNLYTGKFEMSGFAGTAYFGQAYNWTARPAALKVSYKAEVGNIDFVGSSDTEAQKGDQDVSCIYAVVVDWTKQHEVYSGFGVTPTGMWDPSNMKSLEEGAILGYAILNITESTEGGALVETSIPFTWYDKEAKPKSGNYSVVISCATSKRGDYLTGCSTNKLWVDNFAWGY